MEVAWARGRLEETMLADTVDIVRTGTGASDGMGGTIPGTETVTTVACRLREETVQPEATTAGQVMARSLWTFDLPHGTDVTPDDVLRHGGHTYQTGDTNEYRTDGLTLKVQARRIG